MIRVQDLWNRLLRSTVVPYGILLALATSTMAYFVGVGVGLNDILHNPGVIAGIGAGIAAEALLYLMTLNVHASFGAMIRLLSKDPRYAVMRRQFVIFLCLLIGLAIFSAYNQIAFLWGHWTPIADFFLPGWAQMLIRGAISPAMMVLAGFLIPAQQNLAQVLNEMNGADLRSLVRAYRKDLKRRIKVIRDAKGDLAPVVVAYSADMGENEIARRTRLLAEGLAEAEAAAGIGGRYIGAGAGQVEYIPDEGDGDNNYHRAPTAIARYRKQDRTAEEAREESEVTVRRLLASNPKMTRQELMKRGGVSMSDVDHWRPRILEEMGVKPSKKRVAHKPKKTRKQPDVIKLVG